MKIKQIISSLVLCFSLFLVSCSPKDADINQSVVTAVQGVPGVSADTRDGVVTLSGQVMDENSKSAAEEAARKVKGVKSVVNNITVTPPPAPTVSISPDDALRAGVTDAIKDFPNATATVTDGEIVVTGELSADDWKRLKISLDALNPRRVTAETLKIKN